MDSKQLYALYLFYSEGGGGGALLYLFRQVLKITCPEISVPAGLKVQCPEIIVPPIDYSAAKPGESIILQLSIMNLGPHNVG